MIANALDALLHAFAIAAAATLVGLALTALLAEQSDPATVQQAARVRAVCGGAK